MRRRQFLKAALAGIATPALIRSAQGRLLFLNGSGNPLPTVYNAKRRSLIFVGNSISWGFGLTRAQGWPAALQAVVDTHQSHSGTGWEARSVQSDDYAAVAGSCPTVGIPFNGGYSGTPLLTAAGTVATDVIGPYSNYTSGSSPGYCGYTDPGIGFAASHLNGVIMNAGAAATYLVAILESASSGTANYNVYCQGNATPTSVAESMTAGVPVRTINALPGFSGGGTLISLFNTDSSIKFDVLTIHPTTLYSANQVLIQVIARNSFCLADYVAATIQQQAIFTPVLDPSADVAPIYVLNTGTVEMYDVDRNITPAAYQTALSNTIYNLVNGTTAPPVNANGIILTIPLVPDPAVYSSPTYPVNGTLAQWRGAILAVAQQYGCGYLDFQYGVPALFGSALTVANNFYQAGGIHPSNVSGGNLSLTGAGYIAKYIQNQLGL